MEWLTKIVDVLKSPKLSACVVIACAILLFIPETTALKPALLEFRQKYGAYVVVALALGSAGLAVEFLCWGVSRLAGRRLRLASEQHVLKRLLQLDLHEQLVMREFIIQERNTIKLPIEQAVVAGLLRAGLITLVQPLLQRCHAGQVGIFSLSPLVQDYLSPKLVGLPDGQITDEDRKRVFNDRPDFVRQITERERIWES